MVGGLSLRQKLWAARLALAAERFWPPLIPLTGWVGLFIAYALYDGPKFLSTLGHDAVLTIWGIGVFALLKWAFRGLKWPGHFEACRRLEADSGVPHQPLLAQSDPLSLGDASLWAAHVRRMAVVLQSLRPKPPRFNLIQSDPWGTRFWVFVPVALGLLVGGQDFGTRMQRAAMPVLGLDDGLRVWVQPPAATGMAAWELDKTQTAEVKVPLGSIVRAVIGAGWSRAWIRVDDSIKEFEGDGDQHVEMVIGDAHTLSIRRAMLTVAHWSVTTVPDLPPSIAFLRSPAVDRSRSLVRVGLEAHDDYGLAKVWLRLLPQVGAPVDREMPLSGDKPRSVTLEAQIGAEDGALSGQTIQVQPMARDTAGQESSAPSQSVVWPARVYVDAQAKSLAQWRKVLLDDPAQAPEIGRKLDELSHKINDLAGALDVGIAKRDLQQPDPDVADAQGLMLGAANRLEDQAQQKVGQMLGVLGQALDDAMKRGDANAVKRLAEHYAEMLEKMMGSDDANWGQLSMSAQDLEDILGRLDQLAGGKGDAKLRQRLQNLARKLADQSGETSPEGKDLFGNNLGGPATGDDNSTKVPGHNASGSIGPIIDDIRNRLMDGARPKQERDYLKRLLDLPTQ